MAGPGNPPAAEQEAIRAGPPAQDGIPSCSMGFWVAATTKREGRRQLFSPTVIWCSAMASSRADCTLATPG